MNEISIKVEELYAVVTIEKNHPDGGSYKESIYLTHKELRKFLNECKHAKKELVENLRDNLDEQM